MANNLLSISAACLFDDQGNLLLVCKRGTQAFMLPGDKREPDETSFAALQRELLEELHLPMGASTFRYLGSFQAPATNEANTRVDADTYVARLPHAVCARAELKELARPAPGQAQLDNLASLLCDHVLPALARRAVEDPEAQAEHQTRPDHMR